MAEFAFGLDFGTTNSLVAVGLEAGAVSLLSNDRRPHPSVVWYRGTEVVVGAEARSHLELTEGGAAPGFVRSPKMALRNGGTINIEGRTLNPVEVVAEVLRYLKLDAISGDRDRKYDTYRAVFTIPVDFAGPQRRALREAARRAGVGVVQFVHEPAAALYGWIRSHADWRKKLADLEGRAILVFDWGGGTLDLTLCRISSGKIVQISNAGDNEIGGDRFDERLRNLVRDRHAKAHGIDDVSALEHAGMAARLLTECELRKIELSDPETPSVTAFIRDYLKTEGPARTLNVTLSRVDLEAQSGELINRGISHIDRLLDESALQSHDIELCLATGGMVHMPAIREALIERFGARVPKLQDGDQIIAKGAALIAYDNLRLKLAKPIEVLVADGSGRGSYHELVSAGITLPVENETTAVSQSRFFCVDPRDGVATFEFAKPQRLGRPDAGDERIALGRVSLQVDSSARPLRERLSCDVQIDHDYIAKVTLKSTLARDESDAEFHALEFALALPGSDEGPGNQDEPVEIPFPTPSRTGQAGKRANAGKISVRANIAEVNEDHGSAEPWELVPGDIVELWKPDHFAHQSMFASQAQREERDYYRHCARCGRTVFLINRDGPVIECLQFSCGVNAKAASV